MQDGKGTGMTADREQFRRILKTLTCGRILFDEPMAKHASMGVGGRADVLVFPAAISEVGRITAFLQSEGAAFMPVGNCTNLIVRDGGYRGVLICLSDLKALRLDKKPDGRVIITAEAGVALADIVRLIVKESLTGMEFCAGIPGSVGGAVRMNAGAYGREMKDVVEKILIVDTGGRQQSLGAAELRFEYRNLDLSEGAVIVEAELSVRRGDPDEVKTATAEILEQRKRKHPLRCPSAGSIFKNPPGMPAGRIIDELGLKGRAVGGARISERHGNFIVNTGGAKAADILALMDLVRQTAAAERGIDLEPEVKVIGEEA